MVLVGALVAVCVVHVRHVGMLVRQSLVPVPMRVRFARRILNRVHVLMMLIVHMLVRVCHSLMNMLVLMIFRQVQPHAHRHQGAGGCELDRDRFIEQENRR